MPFFNSLNKPFLIAGPCSAESEAQLLEVAHALKGTIHLFRAGVWKPRTRPGSFEGAGEVALKWLQTIKKETALPVAIEVAEPEHIQLAVKYGIDVFWLGARTVVNPFQVQRLANELKNISIPVMVKNPLNPEVDLWIGAIERLKEAGIKDIAAIHRGFSSYSGVSNYRNPPNWPIPIELKRRLPDIPVFSDPSHITGKRSLVADVAQKAMDMNFDGLMIEVHPNPAFALSDAAQQITPQAFIKIISELIIRNQHTNNDSFALVLDSVRRQMDSIDAEIIDLIAKRMELSERMGEVKNSGNITVYQPDRWREIVETRGDRATALLMDKEFIISIFQAIHNESIKTQLSIFQNSSAIQNT